MTEPTASPPPPAPKRRRWPYVLLGVVVLLVIAVLVAPSLLSGTIEKTVETSFREQRRGTLEIGQLDLGWFSRQKVEGVRLLDPQGAEVAQVGLDLPSLWSLATGGGRKIGRVLATVRADLVANDDGTTNLESALEERPEAKKKDTEPEDGGAPTDVGELLRELDLDLEVRVEKLAWSDTRTRAAGKPFAIQDLVAKVAAKPGEPIRVDADGLLASEQPGKIHATVALHDLLDANGLSPQARFELDAAFDSIPSALIDALAQQDGLVAAALGPEFRVKASGAGTLQQGQLELGITGDRGTIVFAGQLAGGVLTGTRKEALQVALRPDRALLDRYVRASLPEGLTVAPIGEPSIDLALEDLRLELQRVLDAVNRKDDVVAAAVGACELSLRFGCNDWSVAGAKLPVEGGVTLSKLRVQASVAPGGSALDAQVSAELGGGASGSLALAAHCDEVAKLVALGPQTLFEGVRGDEPKFNATLELKSLGTAPIAALVPPDIAPKIAMADLLGPTIDVRAVASNAGESRLARATVKARSLDLQAAGWLANGRVVCPAERALDLTVRTDAAVQRTLAGFLPEGTKVQLGESVHVTVGNELSLPLSDLSGSQDVVATLLQKADFSAQVTADRVHVQTAELAAKNQWLKLQGVALDAHLSHQPNAGQVGATLTATVDDPQGSQIRLHAGYPGMGALESLTDVRDLPLARVELDVPRFPVAVLDALAASDGALVTKLGAALGLNARLDVAQSTGAPLKADLDATVPFERGESKITAHLTVDDPFERRGPRPAGALPEISAQFKIDGLRIVEGFLSPELGATVLELLGDSVTGELANRPEAGSKGVDDTTLEAKLDAARVKLAVDARMKDGAVRIGDDPLTLEIAPTPAMVERYVGSKLPQGAKVAFADAEPKVRLQAANVELPLTAWLPAEGAEPAPLAEVLRGTSAHVGLGLPGLSYTQPPLGGTGEAVPISIEQLAIDVKLAAKQPAVAQVRGKVRGTQGGNISLDVTLPDVGALVEGGPEAKLPPFTIKGDLSGLPTGLIDAIASQDGLLVDVLGPEMSLKVSGSSVSDQPLHAELTSSKTKLDLTARVEDGTIEAKGAEGLDAKLPLTPLFSKRIVGNLVPLLLNASKPDDAEPVSLSMSGFTLPLDADLRKLNGSVRLELGRVTYELLPGLGDALAAAGLKDPSAKITQLPPLAIQIQNGVARYERLPFQVAGRELFFQGSFDLVKKELDLKTEIPLELLGKISDELDRARDVLDPKMMVPIELKGTWPKPKIRLGKDFTEKVLKEAAEGALKKGLGDLFKKDKKKD